MKQKNIKLVCDDCGKIEYYPIEDYSNFSLFDAAGKWISMGSSFQESEIELTRDQIKNDSLNFPRPFKAEFCCNKCAINYLNKKFFNL